MSDRKLLSMNKEQLDKLNKNNDAMKTLLDGISSGAPKFDASDPFGSINAELNGVFNHGKS